MFRRAAPVSMAITVTPVIVGMVASLAWISAQSASELNVTPATTLACWLKLMANLDFQAFWIIPFAAWAAATQPASGACPAGTGTVRVAIACRPPGVAPLGASLRICTVIFPLLGVASTTSASVARARDAIGWTSAQLAVPIPSDPSSLLSMGSPEGRATGTSPVMLGSRQAAVQGDVGE